MPTYPATKQLFRRWDVEQLFGICRRTVINWQAAGKLTPVRAVISAKRRSAWCMRQGKRVRIPPRSSVVLYTRDNLVQLARQLLRDVPELGAYFAPIVPLAPAATPFATPLATAPARRSTPTGET